MIAANAFDQSFHRCVSENSVFIDNLVFSFSVFCAFALYSTTYKMMASCVRGPVYVLRMGAILTAGLFVLIGVERVSAVTPACINSFCRC